MPGASLSDSKQGEQCPTALRDLLIETPSSRYPMWCNTILDPREQVRARVSGSCAHSFPLSPLSQGAIILSKLAPEHAVNLDLLSLQGLPCFLCSK